MTRRSARDDAALRERERKAFAAFLGHWFSPDETWSHETIRGWSPSVDHYPAVETVRVTRVLEGSGCVL